MTSHLGSILFALVILVIGCLAILLRRYNLAGKKWSFNAEIALFAGCAAILSFSNSVGFILQHYLENLIHWPGFNIHDLLLGNGGQVRDADTLYSAMPLAAFCSCLALFASRHCKRPLNFFLVFASFFAGGMILVDGIYCLVRHARLLEFQNNVLADAIGAPVEALLATCLYFFLSEITEANATALVRPLFILSLCAFLLLFEALALLGLERLFLLPNPTYFEADISPDDKMLSLILAPPLDEMGNVSKNVEFFDPVSGPYLLADELKVSSAENLELDWKARVASAPISFELYAIKNCPTRLMHDVIKYFKPNFGRPLQATHLNIIASKKYWALSLPVTQWRAAVFDASKKISAKTSASEVVERLEKGGIGIDDLSVKDSKVGLRPTSRDLVFSISPMSGDNQNIKISIDDKAAQFTTPKTTYSAHGPHCSIVGIDSVAVGGRLDPATSALVFSLRLPVLKAGETDSELALKADAGILSATSILPSNKYAKKTASLTNGNLRLLASVGKVAKVRMYGAAVPLEYSGPLVISGENFGASLRGDGTVSVSGTVQDLTTEKERLMKTPWELLGRELLGFILTSFSAILALFGRFVYVIFSKKVDGHWHNWV